MDFSLTPELILDRAPTGVICLDADGRMQFVNPFAAHLMGYDSPEDLVGQPVRTYFQFLTLDRSGEDVCVRDDGSSFPVAYESTPIVGDNTTQGTVVTIRDISGRRAADQRKDELISIVSHELRTPLTAIRSALGLLANGLLGDLTNKGQTVVDIGVNNTDRLIRLVSDLLDLERLNSGQVHLTRSESSAYALMQQAVDSVRAVAEAAHVTIDVAPTTAVVRGNADRLVQVLINLLGNAIKFSPERGSVRLDAEPSRGELVFRVRDEGRGIPADKLETIFERFAQVDEHDARTRQGTGLGLAISRAIVQQHGGQIWAESTPGAGTTLCVALPVRAYDQAFDAEMLSAA